MFRAGDVVQLKCGGMKMVVLMVTTFNEETVTCVWHDRYGHEQRGVFSPYILKLA